MDNIDSKEPAKGFFKKLVNYISENAESIIMIMMIGTMLVAAVAFWAYAAYKNSDNIIIALYCASIVFYLIGTFTGIFKKRKVLITVVILSMAFAFIYLAKYLILSD
jgi:ABC-type multidrug transport system permease subunit